MKKKKNYAGLAVLIVLIMSAIPSVGPWAWGMFQKPGEGIIKSNTDERGLTSVKYVQDGKTWALDYLDEKEVDSLKALFQAGCVNPPPHPCANGYCGATMHQNNDMPCMCCAVGPGQHCKVHGGKALPSGIK